MKPAGKKGILELAQRMTMNFYVAMCGLPAGQPWNDWNGGIGVGSERFELAVHFVTLDHQGVLSATTTVWLPGVPAGRVFHYLCDGSRRGEWDSLASSGPMKEVACVAIGQLYGNSVSVLRPSVSLAATLLCCLILTTLFLPCHKSLMIVNVLSKSL